MMRMQASKPTRGTLRGLIAVATMVVIGAGCPGGGNGNSDPEGNMQLYAAGATAADVNGVLYEITCDSGFTATEYVSMDPSGLPPHIDPTLAGSPFADLFLTMPPGTCEVTATAMIDSTTPAEGCTPATTTVVVNENETTEAVMIIVCDPPPTGALDLIAVVTDGPGVVDISYDPSKFIVKCKEVAVTVTTSGEDVTVTYVVSVTPPGGGTYVLTPTATGFTFYGEVPGMYEVQITVTNAAGTSTFTIPIHIVDDPNVEHCDETCCRYQNGHVNFTSADDCEAAGGVPVAEDICTAIICCQTPSGTALVQASQCPDGSALSDDMCERVCCVLEDGSLAWSGSGAECEAVGGFITADQKCEREVCCKLNGNQIVPITDCPASQVQPMSLCQEPEQCCRLQDGTVTFATATDCDAQGGAIVSEDQCNPKVCCVLEGNIVSTMPQITCEAQGGAVMALEECKKVCCAFPGVPPSATVAALCGPLGGVVVPNSKCKAHNLEHVWTADYTLDLDTPCEPSPYLVVPSSAANKLAVYDLATLAPVGGVPGTPFDTCGSPSRILMDANTDVYATCRSAQNADGVCKHTKEGVVLWCRDFNPECNAFRGIAMSGDGRLFVGCSITPGIVYELDPATGATIQQVTIGHYIYGFAIDGQNLYATPGWTGGLTSIDLATFSINYSLTAAPPGEPAPGGYGITVDQVGFVWTTYGSTIQKQDASDGSVVDQYVIAPPTAAGYVGMYGIQAGLDGLVYASDAANDRVIQFDPIAEVGTPLALDPNADWNHGLTLDSVSNVYTINMSSSTLTKIEAGTGTPTEFGNGGELLNPYGYSGDMTGLTTTCMAGTTDQWFSSVIDSGNPGTTWNTISWTATEPPGSSVAVYYSSDGGVTWNLATNGQVLGIVAQTFQVKVILSASAGATPPTVNDVTVTYTTP